MSNDYTIRVSLSVMLFPSADNAERYPGWDRAEHSARMIRALEDFFKSAGPVSVEGDDEGMTFDMELSTVDYVSVID